MMGKIQIRHSTPKDLSIVLSLIENGRQIMRNDGNLHQWSGDSPSADLIIKDIENGYSYLCIEGEKAIGTFAFIPGPDPGVFSAALDYCFQVTNNIRIDTHRDNHIMQHNLLKHGFQYCGIIFLLNGDERLAYQKIV